MPTEIIGMFADVTGGTQDAAATVDVPFDGLLTGVDWDVEADMDADTERIACELSFIATQQIGTNDVRGRISSISGRMSLTTSGVAVTSLQKFVGPMELIVAGGERIHLHVISSASLVGVMRCNIHLDTATAARSRRRSRRR